MWYLILFFSETETLRTRHIDKFSYFRKYCWYALPILLTSVSDGTYATYINYWTPILWGFLQNHCCLSNCLSVCLSLCQSLRPSVWSFSQKWLSSFFLIFGTMVDNWNILKRTEPFFSRKMHFINLKLKLILLLIFLHQSHIWQNSGSRVMGQNAVSQSYCRII